MAVSKSRSRKRIIKSKIEDRAAMLERLTESSAYRVAYKDLEFLGREALRPVRLQLELLKPELILREHNIASTIVVFGGTRIVEPVFARERVAQLQKELRTARDKKTVQKHLSIARSLLEKSKYYEEAREFARLVSLEGQSNGNREFVIVTGGGPGIMEAANRGAYDVDAKTIGLNITLPMEQQPNPFITPDLCLQFHYFALRKMHFMMRAKALVAFPGGFGTLDELFEALTLVQVRKVQALPIILFGEKYWKRVINFESLVEEGVIDEEDINLFVYADKAVDAWDYIKYYFGEQVNKRTPDVNYIRRKPRASKKARK